MSFKNTLIILTSNVGSSVIAKGGATVGFQMATAGADPEADKYSRVRSLVRRLWGGGGGPHPGEGRKGRARAELQVGKLF